MKEDKMSIKKYINCAQNVWCKTKSATNFALFS